MKGERWPRLDPGACQHRIRWQEKVIEGQNSFGEDQYRWSDVLTCYAMVNPTTGRENSSAGQRWAEADYVIAQPWAAGLREDMRIVWMDSDGMTERYLDVLDISDRLGRRMVLDVAAKEWAAPVVGPSV